MEDRKKHKKIIIVLIISIFVQFIILLFTSNSTQQEIENASAELKHVMSDPSLSITEKAKLLYKKELENKIIAANIRSLNSDEKAQLPRILNNDIEKLKSTNPDKAVELQHQLEVLKTDYNPISYTMEKILNLKSLDFLIYQKNYFFIFLTFLVLVIYILYSYKSKFSKQ